MIRRLRLLSVAAALGFLAACGSPTAPDIPGPDPEDDPDDPSQGMRSWVAPSPGGGFEFTLA